MTGCESREKTQSPDYTFGTCSDGGATHLPTENTGEMSGVEGELEFNNGSATSNCQWTIHRFCVKSKV